MKAQSNTVDKEEIEKFSRVAHAWWDERGEFAPLHRINALRVMWIQNQIKNHLNSVLGTQYSVLDIGCGGGLVSEPMAKLGLHVTGIDASPENIEIAKQHARQSGLDIDYRCTTAEELVSSPRLRGELEGGGSIMPPSPNPSRKREGSEYDIVLALEIIEHVADVPAFVAATCKLVKPGGLIIYSTLNRTAKSFALGIVAAEYVLRWVPRGTHDWNKFVKPSELAAHLRLNNVEVKEMTGLVMNPLNWKWELSERDVDVNYMVAGVLSS